MVVQNYRTAKPEETSETYLTHNFWVALCGFYSFVNRDFWPQHHSALAVIRGLTRGSPTAKNCAITLCISLARKNFYLKQKSRGLRSFNMKRKMIYLQVFIMNKINIIH